MAYHVSFCYTKTGKTFEEALKYKDDNELLMFMLYLYGEASEEPVGFMYEVLHDGKCIRKVHDLNKSYHGKRIFKVKVEKKDED